MNILVFQGFAIISKLKSHNIIFIANISKSSIVNGLLRYYIPSILSLSCRIRRRLAAKAKNISKPNARNAITPTVIDDMVATEIIYH